MKNKVVIIGCGNVGMSYAYCIVNQKTNIQELVLIDLNMKKVEGEVMDLNHCLPFGPSKLTIKAGNYEDCTDASIICIAAGANQNPGETRMDLIHKNSVIFKDIISKIMKTGFNGIFLVATNPLDIMTYITWKYSGLPTNQVIGSGTSLDTSRLRFMLSERLNVNPKNIHAYVIGEHGDSEFIPWSLANVGVEKITDYLSQDELDNIYVDVRDAAYEIINRKGATYYGIGMCLTRITNAILGDENSIITVSTYDKDNNIFIGKPAILNRNGIVRKIKLPLTDEEKSKLQKSVDIIKKAISEL